MLAFSEKGREGDRQTWMFVLDGWTDKKKKRRRKKKKKKKKGTIAYLKNREWRMQTIETNNVAYKHIFTYKKYAIPFPTLSSLMYIRVYMSLYIYIFLLRLVPIPT